LYFAARCFPLSADRGSRIADRGSRIADRGSRIEQDTYEFG